MPSTKSRNWSPEEDQALEYFMNHRLNQQNKTEYTWNEIAQQIASNFQNKMASQQQNGSKNFKFTKSGKQCRQRWINHLDQGLNKDSKWSVQENKILFDSHNQLGNKWSTIAKRLTGRTDNCVKNHFYSVLRRGMRKINQYIQQVKRKESLVKTFKNQMLNKILLLSESEGKYDDKFHFKNSAKELAIQIKSILISLSGEDWDNNYKSSQNQKAEISEQQRQSENNKQILKLQQMGYNMINQFAKNCKKKKSKKVIEEDEDQYEQQCVGKHKDNKDKNKKKSKKNQENVVKEEAEEIQQKNYHLGKQYYHEEYQDDIIDNDNSYNLNSPSSFKINSYNDYYGISNNKSVHKNSINSVNYSDLGQKQQKIGQFNSIGNFSGEAQKKIEKFDTFVNNAEKFQKKSEAHHLNSNTQLNNLEQKQPANKNKPKILKCDSINQSQIDEEVLQNIGFVQEKLKHNNNDFLVNQQWFNKSGTEYDAKFGDVLGVIDFQGSHTELFGASIKKDNDCSDQDLYQKYYTSECVDMAKNFNQIPGFMNSNLNESQQIDKMFKISQSPAYFNRSGQSLNFSSLVLNSQLQQQLNNGRDYKNRINQLVKQIERSQVNEDL